MTIPPLPASAPVVGPVMVGPETVPEHAGAMALMSNATRDGEWLLPRRFRAVAVMGQVDLDLTRVRLAPGVSEIEAIAVMGQVNIIVPHNLRVECQGDPILGDFSIKWVAASAAVPDAPLISVRGTAFMGGVSVKVVDPTALGWFDRWRARRLARGQG